MVSSSRFEASVGWRDASESPSQAGLAPRLFSRISGKRKRAGATSRHPELDQRPAARYLTRSAAFPRIGAEKSNLCQQQSEANTSKSKRRAVAAIRTRNPRSTPPPPQQYPTLRPYDKATILSCGVIGGQLRSSATFHQGISNRGGQREIRSSFDNRFELRKLEFDRRKRRRKKKCDL